MTRYTMVSAALAAVLAAGVMACKSTKREDAAPGPSAQPAASDVPLAEAVPVPAATVSAAVNPGNDPPYDGPTGSVEGMVKVTGDPPAEQTLNLSAECAGAAQTYRYEFREGPERTAADVMVAVTGYKGFVPAKGPAVTVTIRDCAYDRRTVIATFGQRFEVWNGDDKTAFVPFLVGDTAAAHMVAIPKGAPVKLYPKRVGHYLLADEMKRPWMKAEVFVVKFPFHHVTGIDGRYRIDGIPVGQVKVDILLPAIDGHATKDAMVEEGKTATVDFVLNHDHAAEGRDEQDKKKPRPEGPVIR